MRWPNFSEVLAALEHNQDVCQITIPENIPGSRDSGAEKLQGVSHLSNFTSAERNL